MFKDEEKQTIRSIVDDEISIIDTLENEEEDIHKLNEQHIKRVEKKLITEYKGNIKSRLSIEQKKEIHVGGKIG